MKSLVESILDADYADATTSKMEQLQKDYEQCVLFAAWRHVAHDIFNKASTDYADKGLSFDNKKKAAYFKLWKKFLVGWVNDKEFHSFFNFDDSIVVDQPLDKYTIKYELDYIDGLQIDSEPEMNRMSSGSSYEHFFDGDQIYACDFLLYKRANALGKRSSVDINKKIREIERKYHL